MILDYKFAIFSFIFIDLQSPKVEISKLEVFSFFVFGESFKTCISNSFEVGLTCGFFQLLVYSLYMSLDYNFVIFGLTFNDLQSSEVGISKLKIFNFSAICFCTLYYVKILTQVYLIRLNSD